MPRDYQVDGARLLAYSGRLLLGDEPGVGKSACTILGIAWRQYLGHPIFPAIIVMPSWDIADSFQREITRWMPEWRTVMWGGPKRQELAGTADVYLTTYATLRRDAADAAGPLVKLRAVTVIGDEIHVCGRRDTRQSQALRRIARQAGTFAGLSGTIVTRDMRDLGPILDAMDHASWPSGERYKNRYAIAGNPDYGETVEGLDPLRKDEFFTCLMGSFRRVAKADVLTQLPPKIYSVRRVKMPPDWQKTYDGMEDDMLAELPDGQELPAFDALTRMNALSQMASCAFDVEITEGPEIDEWTGEPKKHYHLKLKRPCWKGGVLLEILDERRGAAPVVSFAPSRQLMMIAGQMAEEAGYRVGYVLGIGQGVTRKKRSQAISDFQDGKLDLLCATGKAGGTGITLTAAGTVVFLRRSWELDSTIQEEDRAHRLGSEIHTNGIEIIDIITVNSVEYRIRDRIREKGASLAEICRDERIVRELLGGR